MAARDEEASALIDALDQFAGDIAQSVYWLSESEEFDCSHDFCRSCAEQNVAGHLECIDGGDWYSGESDGSRVCYNCGQCLAYSLTDYGASEELVHFIDNPLTAPISRQTAYEVARLLSALPESPEALGVGRLAVSLIGDA